MDTFGSHATFWVKAVMLRSSCKQKILTTEIAKSDDNRIATIQLDHSQCYTNLTSDAATHTEGP